MDAKRAVRAGATYVIAAIVVLAVIALILIWAA